MNDTINRLLEEHGIHPVLMEVGPRQQPPEIWNGIARASIYIGAGPDSGLSSAGLCQKFYRAHTIDKVVTNHEARGGVVLNVTRDPVYSSVLTPKAGAANSEFLDDQCLLERRVSVASTTLNELTAGLELAAIDWLNTNVNGLDFRLYQSLQASLRHRLLAVDTIVDLVDFWDQSGSPAAAYQQFVDEGFWLSQMSSYGLPRMRPESVQKLRAMDSRFDESFFSDHLKRSPGWMFVRFLRTLESLAAGGFAPRDYILLWTFALLDEQLGYAADVAFEFGRAFGDAQPYQTMVDETVERVRQLVPTRARHGLGRWSELLARRISA